MHFTIGSRGSKLALWQAEWVRSRLAEFGHSAEIKIIATTGDRMAPASLSQPQTKGFFIKEIEEELAAGGVDLAVHSLKDLPVDQPDGLTLAALTGREDARDALIARPVAAKFQNLAPGARVGTSSLRRQSQLLHLRPDIEIIPIRGNVDTRIRKLERGDCEAVVMAAAGLRRLGLQDRISEYFSVDQVCPAAGQGVLAIEIRRGDGHAARAVEPLDHTPTRFAVRAERALLRNLGGGCLTPIAAFAEVSGGSLKMTGVVASPDGVKVIRALVTGPADDPESAGARLAKDLLRQGAASVLS